MTTHDRDDGAEIRRQIIRRAGIYTWGLFATAMVVALGGAALVALLIRPAGVPFVTRWLVLSAIVLLPSAIGYLIQQYRESRRRALRRRDFEGSEEWRRKKD